MGNILNINEIIVDNSIVSNDLIPSYLSVCLCALSKQNGEVADARYIRNHRNQSVKCDETVIITEIVSCRRLRLNMMKPEYLTPFGRYPLSIIGLFHQHVTRERRYDPPERAVFRSFSGPPLSFIHSFNDKLCKIINCHANKRHHTSNRNSPSKLKRRVCLHISVSLCSICEKRARALASPSFNLTIPGQAYAYNKWCGTNYRPSIRNMWL